MAAAPAAHRLNQALVTQEFESFTGDNGEDAEILRKVGLARWAIAVLENTERNGIRQSFLDQPSETGSLRGRGAPLVGVEG